jgi:Lrp/AsnC family leucine-responsive transcriptional regulator
MMSAFIFIQVGGLASMAEMKQLHDDLHGVPGVKTVHAVAGPIDVIVFADAADQAALGNVIGGIRAVKGVASTDTRIVISM